MPRSTDDRRAVLRRASAAGIAAHSLECCGCAVPVALF